MSELNINLKYCWNIENWTIKLEQWKLNIKYAINWTWKSTIARAFKYHIENNVEDKEILKPYKYFGNDNKNPEVLWLNNFQNIKIFNEDYIKQYTFKKEEILENSFSILINDDNYKQWIQKIEDLIKSLKNIFQEDNNLEKLIEDTYNFLNFIKITWTWKINETSTIIKWLEWSKKINNPPKTLEWYTKYLTKTDINSKYISWQLQWKDYLWIDETNCPYCISWIDSQKKEVIGKFSSEYQKSEIDNLNKILSVIEWLYEYFNKPTKDTIDKIKNNISWISDEEKSFLIKLREEIDTFNKKLNKVKLINFYDLKEIDSIEDEIKKYLFNLDDSTLYNYINSDFTKNKVKAINDKLNELIWKVSYLKWEINKQKQLLKKSIEKYKENINNFFTSAWYKYLIDVINEENNKYKFVLKPIDKDIEVKNTSKNLSFWEKNAFALVLFMYQTLNEKADLIILDDPISSFDKNKKFAILNVLFWKSEENLRWKTVLMLTHDFEPIIDIIKNWLPKSLNNKNAFFLENKNGNLNEIEIKREHIKTFNKICNENLTKWINNINKCIFLRRLFEIEDNKWLEYNLLSSLIHKKDIPNKRNNDWWYDNLTDEEINQTTEKIKIKIPDFDYNTMLNSICNSEELLEIYQNSSSNYEKFQIYRIIKDDWNWNVIIDDSVIKKFIDESFHIENEYLFQLNPIDYELIPSYIIEECNKDLNL